MSVRNDLKEYSSRWEQVNAIVKAERSAASYVLRWKQLNSAYGMAKGLGLLQPDESEMEVFEKWARLKEKADSQTPKA